MLNLSWIEVVKPNGELVVNPKKPIYRRLSHRDILRSGDQYKTSGKWLPVYGPATGSKHLIGNHPYPGTEYRRPR
jgi:hypothetical protein